MKNQALFAIMIMTVPISVSGQFFVDNLGEPPGFVAALRSDFWHATSFTTGPNPDGYSLETVSAAFLDPIGSPSDYQMKIAPDAGGMPGMAVQSLVGSAPTVSGIFNYDSPGMFLAPNSTFWVIQTSSASGGSEFSIDLVDSSTEVSVDGWLIGDALFSSADQGGTWGLGIAQPARIGIDAFAVVPEPGGGIVVTSLTLGVFVAWRRRSGWGHAKKTSLGK